MRGRLLELVGLCACVLIACWLVARWTGGKPSRQTASLPAASEAQHAPDPASWIGGSQSRPARLVPPPERVTFTRGHPNPVIEGVRVDKLEVCAGEENFAHPDVHTVDDTDADLRISLAGAGFLGRGSTGGKMPFRLLGPMDPAAMPVVIVEGANGTHAERRLPFIKVKACSAPPPLHVEALQVPERGLDVFAFQATGGAGGSAWLWDFGDGVQTRTTEPRVVHDFHGRRQRSRFSEFLVTVETTDSGARRTGSMTVELFNRAYWASRVHPVGSRDASR